MKELFLNQDSEGNFLIDLAGLLYLVRENCIEEGTPVYMIEKSGMVTEYCLEREKLADGRKGFALLLMEELGHPFYLEFDAYALDATYFVLAEHVELAGQPKESEETFVSIDFREALALMDQGDTVYLKEDDILSAKTAEDSLMSDQLLYGTWLKREKKQAAGTTLPTLAETSKTLTNVLGKKERLLMDFLDLDEHGYRELKAEIEAEEATEAEVDIISQIPLDVCHEIIRTLEEAGMISMEEMEEDEDANSFFTLENKSADYDGDFIDFLEILLEDEDDEEDYL